MFWQIIEVVLLVEFFLELKRQQIVVSCRHRQNVAVIVHGHSGVSRQIYVTGIQGTVLKSNFN